MNKPNFEIGKIVRVTVDNYSELHKITGYTTWQGKFAYDLRDANALSGIALPNEISIVEDSESMLWVLEHQ